MLIDFTGQALQLLRPLYGDSEAGRLLEGLEARIRAHRRAIRPPGAAQRYVLSQRDSVLITYGDMVQAPGEAPLATLHGFLRRWVGSAVNSVHILPFFPSSSDDGFAVVDYRQVDPQLGSWQDLERMAGEYRLMFDAVINHCSARSAWFQAFVRDEPGREDDFIRVDPRTDLSKVVRPRTSPLLTPFETVRGREFVWTTFSADQVDLNYRNPAVLLEILDVLLFYVSKGASLLRLDAIAYLWKDIGTDCIHRPETHALIRLMRLVLDRVAPDVLLITETNVPHADNISYFGDGEDEAQMVYNFALPPLVLHAVQTGRVGYLRDWAASLTLPSGKVSFFNFLASHDGIGLNPARGILPDAAIEALVTAAIRHGGQVSYKAAEGGAAVPYELNINYFDALNAPGSGEPLELQIDRFLAAQAAMLALLGVPGIYFHSLFGSSGWPEGAAQSGRARTINRQKFSRPPLEAVLSDKTSRPSRVLARFLRLLEARATHAAFDPHGRQQVIDVGEAVFGFWRLAPGDGPSALCLHNLSGQPQEVACGAEGEAFDLLAGERVSLAGRLPLKPYQVRWLQRKA